MQMIRLFVKRILAHPKTSAAGIAAIATGIQIIVKNHAMITDSGTIALLLGGLIGLVGADGKEHLEDQAPPRQ